MDRFGKFFNVEQNKSDAMAAAYEVISSLHKQFIPPQVSFETLTLRYLIEIMADFQITLKDIYNLQSKTFVDPYWLSSFYNALCIFKSDSGIEFDLDELTVVNKFFSQDFHEREDLIKFADIMQKYSSLDGRLNHYLNFAFAVDGSWNHFEYKYYVDNLQYKYTTNHSCLHASKCKDYTFLHVNTVRKLYNERCSHPIPSEIQAALMSIVENTDKENELAEDYKKFTSCYTKDTIDLIKKRMEIKYIETDIDDDGEYDLGYGAK